MLETFLNNFVIVDKKFLSVDECNDIKNKIIKAQNLYQKSQVEYFSYLPLGLYLTNPNEYKKIVVEYNPIMYNLFGLYYEKLRNVLQSNLGILLDFHKNLNFPGFHISNGKNMITPNFHRDRFHISSLLDKKIRLCYNRAKILSVIAIISVPKNGAGLLVRKDPAFQKLKRHKLEYDFEYNYEQGMLAIWDGELMHSIKPFYPTDTTDHRITMQCHIAIANNKGYLFW